MEEEDEFQSPPPASPIGSPENGRISVTVAAAPPIQLPQQQQQNSLALVLPSQRNGGGGGREDCWSEGATGVLIDAWGERYLELSRGNLKQKHWKEVADIVSSREDYTKALKTDIQCKNRIDTVKKKYKLEKVKIMSGGGTSKWVFFEKLDQLIGPTAKIPVTAAATASAVRVPLGIPVGMRNLGKNQKERNVFVGGQRSRMELRKKVAVEMELSEEESRDSIDSFPPEKRKRVEGESSKGNEKEGWGDSVKLLTQAILKFGEAYEQAESAKLHQLVEMEKQRMKFAKEMELQRMQLFMKTQLEISQLKHARRTGNAGNHHRSSNKGNNNISDCSN